MSTRLKKIDDYKAFLDEMWGKHLQEKPESAPTVISTFAGGGGSSLGYSMAGFRELLAVEWDDNAVETFKLNFHDVPVYHGDIANLSVDEVLSMTGLKVGELDIFDGSPPCQGFSTAGKRKVDDPRNQLFKEFTRLLSGLQPKVFVMENVSGMVKGKMKFLFVEILKELKGCGYDVSAKLLNAMYFGVPQSRQRLIFVGVRKDLGMKPSHPKAETKPMPLNKICIDATGSKSQQINSDTPSNKPHVTIQKLAFLKETINTNGGRREPTILELMDIGSFPCSFSFASENKSDIWQRIGNSVPPLFMYHIAKNIRENILTSAS
jgi:DNA (cytosine-5)-methyltransferase 1